MMMIDLIKEHLPEWIEVGVVLGGLLIGAIAAASVTYYKVDQVYNEVQDISASLEALPVLMEKVAQQRQRIDGLEKDVATLEDRIYNLREVDHAR